MKFKKVRNHRYKFRVMTGGPRPRRRFRANLNAVTERWVRSATRQEPLHRDENGIIGFMRGLANDVAGDGVTANTVLPGLTNTLAIAAQSEEQQRATWEQQAIKRLGEPRDLTGAVLFLTSDDAAFITGTAVIVDGG